MHDCHDENPIRGRLIEKRVGEPGNDDPTNAATEWSTNFGKGLNSQVGSLHEGNKVLSEVLRLGFVARGRLKKLRSPLRGILLGSPKLGARVRDDLIGGDALSTTAFKLVQASFRLREPELFVPRIRLGVETGQQALCEPRAGGSWQSQNFRLQVFRRLSHVGNLP